MLLDAGRLALGTLTAVRVGPPSHVDRAVAGSAMVVAPLAVLPLGVLVTALALAGRSLGLPTLVVGFVAVGALSLGSRALHLDGLSDTADGLTASYDAERSLEVMKSGTAGPAGVVAVVVVLGMQAAALAGVLGRSDRAASAVLVGLVVCTSRAALSLCCSHRVPAARPDGLGVPYTRTVSAGQTVAVWAVCVVALVAVAGWAGLPWWRGALAAAVQAAVVMLLVARAVARFGGVTGDVFGAAIELALAAGLVALS